MGPRFKVSSEILEERGVEPAIPELQGQHASHCATLVPTLFFFNCTQVDRASPG